jgi:hypothetical protein
MTNLSIGDLVECHESVGYYDPMTSQIAYDNRDYFGIVVSDMFEQMFSTTESPMFFYKIFASGKIIPVRAQCLSKVD